MTGSEASPPCASCVTTVGKSPLDSLLFLPVIFPEVRTSQSERIRVSLNVDIPADNVAGTDPYCDANCKRRLLNDMEQRCKGMETTNSETMS
jgi:hypothetical protein